MFLGLLNPDPDPFVKSMVPDLSIIKKKNGKLTRGFFYVVNYFFVTFYI
jgi:hypothetical protein